MALQGLGEPRVGEVESEPAGGILGSEPGPRLVKPAVKALQPAAVEGAEEIVIGALVGYFYAGLKGQQGNPEVLGAVAEGKEVGKSEVQRVGAKLDAAPDRVVAQRSEIAEEGGRGFPRGVGIDSYHEDLARGIAEHTVEIKRKNMHGWRF